MVTELVGVLHVATCITLVIVVLLQQGKGADVGAVFGGSSSTVFGASGAGGFLVQLTWGLAALFFATSVFLAYASTSRVTGSIFEGRAPVHSAAPVKPGSQPLSKPAAPVRTAPNPAPPTQKK